MLWWTLRRLRANNPEVRRRAVAALLKRRDARTVGVLIAALDDFSSEVRTLAARALGEIADPQAVEPLVLALKTWSRWDRWAAAEALVKIGGAAVEPLVEVLRDLDVEVRKAAVEVLEKVGGARAITLLRTVLEDHDYAMRQHTATTLESLGWQPESAPERVLQHIATGRCEAALAEGPEAVETLMAALRLNDANIRAEVAITLGRIGDVRAIEPLVTALVDLDGAVRLAAAEALARLGDRRAFDGLLVALRGADASSQSRLRAIHALSLIGDARAIEPLLAATTDADQAVRQAAAQVLGEIKGAETVTPLLTALKTKDETVGDHASETLAKLGHSAVTPLLTAMKDEDRRVRTRAAEALTKIGTAAVGPLLEALQDKRRDVRQSAAEALAKAGDRWAVEPLVTMLWDPDSDVRQAAAESLAALGWQPMDAIERARETVARRAWPTAATLGMAAVEPLQDALQDRRQDVRRGAAEALKMLGWQSTGPPTRLWLAIAFDKTSAAVALGADAVEPLLAVLERWDAEGRLKAAEILGQIGDVRAVKALVGLTNDPQVAETAMQALQHILQASSTAVDTEDLRRVVALDRVVQARRQIRTSRGIVYIRGATAAIDCAYIRQLAQQELQRRGIQV